MDVVEQASLSETLPEMSEAAIPTAQSVLKKFTPDNLQPGAGAEHGSKTLAGFAQGLALQNKKEK